VETIPAAARHDLTDKQWMVLEPLLPRGKKPGRPPIRSKRQLIDGIRWRTRAGAPWRDVPECYGLWQSVYSLFRRWQRAGSGVRSSPFSRPGLITWDVSVDSTIARAHQHAAGARRDPQAQAEPPATSLRTTPWPRHRPRPGRGPGQRPGRAVHSPRRCRPASRSEEIPSMSGDSAPRQQSHP
jgi:transposase